MFGKRYIKKNTSGEGGGVVVAAVGVAYCCSAGSAPTLLQHLMWRWKLSPDFDSVELGPLACPGYSDNKGREVQRAWKKQKL